LADESEVKVKIGTELTPPKNIDDLKSSLTKFGEESGSIFSAKMAVGFAAGQAIYNSVVGTFKAIAGSISGAIDAASESGQVFTRLNFALQNNGIFTEAASQRLGEFATQMMNTTSFSDEQVASTMALGEALGRFGEKDLIRATKAATDLSVAIGVDLDSAMRLVSKASQGHIEAFTRYGISIQKGKTDAETFANTLAVLEGRFSGTAAVMGQTFGGASASAKNWFGEIAESIGKIITENPATIKFLKDLTEGFKKAVEVINILSPGLKTMLGDLLALAPGFSAVKISSDTVIDSFRTIGNSIAAFVVQPLQFAWNAFRLFFQAVITGFQTIYSAFGQMAGLISDGLNALGIKNKFTEELDGIREVTASVAAEATEKLKSIWTESTGEAATSWADSVALETDRAAIAMEGSQKKMATSTQQSAEGIARGSDVAKRALDLNPAVAQGVVSATQKLTASLAKGQLGFKEFSNIVLASFGDMMIQTGTSLVLTGFAFEALRSSILAMSGGPAIFAGVALIAMGTLLKSLSGGAAGESLPGGGGGGGGVASSSSTMGPETGPRPEMTGINVTVHGSVIGSSREELSRGIAEILNEGFDKEGVVVRGMA
jgi:hypothetical protein